MNNNDKLCKENILRRPSLRGLKKCISCGFLNGQRSLVCRNVNCELRQKALDSIRPFDPIQLITYNDVQLYSLRSKEKLISLRNFVAIGKQSLDLDLSDNAAAAAAYAACYVEKCQYDTNNSSQQLRCKHIKACSSLNGNLNKAEAYHIDKSVLWNLNINEEKKRLLWQLYQSEEKSIPAVQRINSNMFAVKCITSDVFPAGRLHTTLYGNNAIKKKGTFACACKKLKIIVEADTVAMKNEICDHLLLILASILTHKNHKTLFTRFLDALQTLWMPTYIPLITNVPINSIVNEDFGTDNNLHQATIGSSKNVISDCHETVDIFNFTEEMLNESAIPDFVDIEWDMESSKPIPTESNEFLIEFKTRDVYMKDPKLLSTSTVNIDEDIDLIPTFSDMKSTVQLQSTINKGNNFCSPVQTISFSHPITDKIRLVKESNLSPAIMDNKQSLLKPFDTTSISKVFIKKIGIPKKSSSVATYNESELNQHTAAEIVSIDPLQVFALQSDSLSKRPRITQSTEVTKEIVTTNVGPSLSYIKWLEHIIEILNDSIAVKETNNVRHNFHVCEEMFTYFSKSFSLNINKRRLPNTTSIIKNGKYKGLMKYVWYFMQRSTVERIFSTRNLQLITERTYELLNDGSFAPFKPNTFTNMPITKGRLICPKVKLWKVLINFNTTTGSSTHSPANNKTTQRAGLKIEWLPVYPKSHFGLMTVEFCVCVHES
uniref:Zf-tcix domain-containing protein n=1 Tax=Glossina brevipalpis TaxID=37001 RepID=A0A1A9WYQ9_9MUSC